MILRPASKRRRTEAAAILRRENKRHRTEAAAIRKSERKRLRTEAVVIREREEAEAAVIQKRHEAEAAVICERHYERQLRVLELPHGFDLTHDLTPFQHAMFSTPKANKDHRCQFPVPNLPHTLPDTHTPIIRAGEYYLRDGGYTGGLGVPYCLGCGLAVGIVVRVYS